MITPRIETQTTQTDRETISQSPHRNNTQYTTSQQNYRSRTPKYHRLINQVQYTEETQLNPPGADNTENSELQLNLIHCQNNRRRNRNRKYAFNKHTSN